MKNVFSLKSIECDLKSNPNLGSFFSYFYVLGLLLLISHFFLSNFLNILFLLFFVFVMCFLLGSYVNVFYFYEKYIRISYLFRISKRNKFIRYSQIERVRYIHRGGRGSQPMIIILGKGQQVTRILKPSNSFTHRFYSDRRKILEFLYSKDIKIEIESDFERDKDILRGKVILGPPF